jgi:low temperature requirement protein LtrA
MIVFGESVVAVAVATSGTEWRLDSAVAAVLGFAAVAGTWWLYFDRQANVVLRSSTRTAVIYSYAHLPLLMGLAATSAGLRLLIERAGEDRLGTGPGAAFIGGIVVFLISLVATRSVTVTRPRRVGISLKLATAAILLGLLAVEAALPPVALAGGVAFVLAAMVLAERTIFPPSQQAP